MDRAGTRTTRAGWSRSRPGRPCPSRARRLSSGAGGRVGSAVRDAARGTSGPGKRDARGDRPGGEEGSGDGSRRLPKAKIKRDIERVAGGTFETPAGGGTVRVSGVGFEPDVLLVTATGTGAGPATTAGPDRGGPPEGDGGPPETDGGPPERGGGPPETGGGPSERGRAIGRDRRANDGWSVGVARLVDEGRIDQEVVASGADSLRSAGVPESLQSGNALEVAVRGPGRVTAVTGRVTATDADGFEFAVDTAGLPADVTPGSYQVTYQAYNTAPESSFNLTKAFKLVDKNL